MVVEHAPVDVAVVDQAFVDGGRIGGLAPARALEGGVEPLDRVGERQVLGRVARGAGEDVVADGAEPRHLPAEGLRDHAACALEVGERRGRQAGRDRCRPVVLRHHVLPLCLRPLQGRDDGRVVIAV